MYQVQFEATTSADWAEAIELVDDATNLPLDIPEGTTFELTIGDCCWPGLNASTDDGKIIMPSANVIQWRFLPADLTRYWSPGTYPVGLTMTTTGGTTQLLVGTLSIIDGVVR